MCNQINNIDKDFEITDKDINKTINTISRHKKYFKQILGFNELKTLKDMKNSIHQIDSILKNGKKKISAQQENNFNRLKTLINDMIESVCQKYPQIIKKIETLILLFDKYFVSLSNIDFTHNSEFTMNDSIETSNTHEFKIFMNSVFNYETKREEYIDSISKILKSLKSMHETFVDSFSLGLSPNSFCLEVRDIAIKCDVCSLTAILVIPEYSFQLKKCIQILKDWLKLDYSYIPDIEADMKLIFSAMQDIDCKKTDYELWHNKLKYQLKTLNSLINNFEIQKKSSYENKRTDYIWQQEELEDKVTIKQFQKNNLEKERLRYKSVSIYNSMELRKVHERINTHFIEVNNEIPKIVKQINGYKFKLLDINHKEKELENLKDQHNEINNKIKTSENKLSSLNSRLCQLCAYWIKLKNICLYKKSSQSLVKIHYKLPFRQLNIHNPYSSKESPRITSSQNRNSASVIVMKPLVNKNGSYFLNKHIFGLHSNS